MDFKEAVNQFQHLLHNISPDSKLQFLSWLKENIESECNGTGGNMDSGGPVMVILNAIRADIRQAVPINAVMPSENLHFPKVGKNADLDPKTTCHMDAFLYDDDTIDELCDKGLMSRNYCAQCGSQDVRPLDFITHSMSVTQLQYLFKFLLPNLKGKTVLDVGSRTGAVLYSAFLFSDAKHIVGVELSQEFCQLQAHIVAKYNMQDRVEVIHNDIVNVPDKLQASDVIVIYNAFEFFLSVESQERMWQFLAQTLRRPGCLLVTSPSVEESLSDLKTGINLATWLKPVPVAPALDAARLGLFGKDGGDSDLEISDLHLYKVL